MGIKTKSCEEHTTLRELHGRTVYVFSPPDDSDSIDDEFAVDASAVGTKVTLAASPLYLPGCGVCVQFSDGAVTLDGSSSVTFKITGVDQFGSPQIESVTITNAVAVQSNVAFRKIIEIEMTAKSGVGAGGTCDVGWANYASGRKIGLPFKPKDAGDIIAILPQTANVAPTLNPTVSVANATVTLPASGYTNTITNPIGIVLADHANLKY